MTGQTTSHYRISEKLGEGATGEVLARLETASMQTSARHFLLLLVSIWVSLWICPDAAKAQSSLPDLALQSPQLITNFGPDHVKSSRGAQGVPGMERTTKGRLWAAWYAGKSPRGVESPSSYVVLATSGDHGKTWPEKLVIQR